MRYVLEHVMDYYPYGKILREYVLERERFQTTHHERDAETGLDYRGARFYDSDLGRFLSLDPLAMNYPQWSDYNYVLSNPILFVDPDGKEVDDWYLNNSTGKIEWHNGSTTVDGYTNLGEDLTFKFNSYIDSESWDGPGGSFPAGDKLTSTIKLNASQDSNGNLVSVNLESSFDIGKTGGISLNEGRDYFPGLGENQNKSMNIVGKREFNATFEQHASVPFHEATGLGLLGYDVVNVAQKVTIGLKSNSLTLTASTDVFPSASFSVNGHQLFDYKQPSFEATHGQNIKLLSAGDLGELPIREVESRRPDPNFYERHSQ